MPTTPRTKVVRPLLSFKEAAEIRHDLAGCRPLHLPEVIEAAAKAQIPEKQNVTLKQGEAQIKVAKE
jgi:hypothetical protein